jgi:poly(3-hydroxybutyrate) depolymerase
MLGLLGPMATNFADYRRQWEELLLPAPSYLDAQPSRLVEVTGFEPVPGNLRMLRHVPDGLAPGAPLVVVLHGCTQAAAAYDHGTGWSALADRLGFALLLPEQQRVNNPNGKSR